MVRWLFRLRIDLKDRIASSSASSVTWYVHAVAGAGELDPNQGLRVDGCDGEIATVDGALDSPSEREIVHQERMKHEG